MKIFLSWSGDQSKKVADFLYDWLPKIVQVWEPWVSTQNIESGEAWFKSIDDNITATYFGIICLTPDNVNNPWINYEAGALRKGLSAARVPILLIDLKSNDFNTPLSGINHVLPNKDGIIKMIITFNNNSISPIKENRIIQAFETYWPEFEFFYNNLIDQKEHNKLIPRDSNSIIDEILTRVKLIGNQLDTTYQKNIENLFTYITIIFLRNASEYTFGDDDLSFLPIFLKSETNFSSIRSPNNLTIIINTHIPVVNTNVINNLNLELENRGLKKHLIAIEPIVWKNEKYINQSIAIE